MNILNIRKSVGSVCQKCGEDAAFKVLPEREILLLTQLCRSCCQKFVEYIHSNNIDTSAMVEKCRTCGQTIKENKSP